MNKLISILFIILSVELKAQFTIDSAVSQAFRNYQYELESGALTESGELSVRNAGNSRYPIINLDYSSTYQNQQIEFPNPAAPGGVSKPVPLDFHRALINFSQNIYDGSMAAHKVNVEKALSQNKQYELNLEKIKLRSLIVQLYMAVLLIEKNLDITVSKMAVLNKQISRLESAVSNGSAFVSDKLILEAERISLNQINSDLKSRKKLKLEQLSLHLGLELTEETEFQVPDVSLQPVSFEQRPDLQLLRNQIKLLDSKRKLTTSSRLPGVRIFGSAGMGSPGYNILDNSWQPMGLVGIGVRWNIWDWKSAGNEKKVISLQQQNLEYSLKRQQVRLSSELSQQQQEINRLEEVMKDDEMIIKLRNEVLAIKTAQLENGVITASDYIVDLNNKNMAELTKIIHELEMIQARLNYNIISGN